MLLKEMTKGRIENAKGWVKNNLNTLNSGLIDLKLEEGTFSANVVGGGLVMETNNEGVFVNWLINQK